MALPNGIHLVQFSFKHLCNFMNQLQPVSAKSEEFKCTVIQHNVSLHIMVAMATAIIKMTFTALETLKDENGAA